MTRKKKIVAAAFILFVVIYVCLSYLDACLADALKTALEREAFAPTGLQLDLGVVEINTVRGDLLALGPRVIDPARAEILVLAQRLAIDAEPWSVIGGILTINRIDLWKLESVLDMDAEGTSRLLTPLVNPHPYLQRRGLRIDNIDVYVEEVVMRYRVPEAGTIDWKVHPANLSARGITLPLTRGSQICSNFSARLIEPSTGTAEAQFVFTRVEHAWQISGRKEVQIAQATALNPYLPADFPLVVLAGGLSVQADVMLHGTIVESTAVVVLSQPRFEPRENVLSSLFPAASSLFAAQAIRESTGDMKLDPICISGDLSDPEAGLREQFLTDLRRQILRRIFQRATSIPSDAAKQLEDAAECGMRSAGQAIPNCR